jgi:DNA-binding NtrC family response regulator
VSRNSNRLAKGKPSSRKRLNTTLVTGTFRPTACWSALEKEGAMLAGCRVLVVEDEALVAADIGEMLLEAEGILIGPAASVSEARQFIKDGVALDAALLDINLSDGLVTPVLEALSARGIPTVVFTGGMVPDDVRFRHPELVALSKPVLPARLIGELRKVVGAFHARSSHR